jgi:manganese transport protein
VLPALAVLGSGIDPTSALVLCQVFPSFGIRFALIPLLMATSRTDVLGTFVNGRGTLLVLVPIAA